MNTSTLHIADTAADFADTDSSFGDEPKSKPIPRTPPPNFVVMRDGKLETLRADSREDAEAKIQNQVKIGQIPVVYIFELMAAVMFEPGAITLQPEEIAERLRAPTASGMGE